MNSAYRVKGEALPSNRDDINDKRSNTMTLRIDKTIMSDLRNEARKRETSLNSLVNQIFKNFAEWHAFDAKIGMVPLPNVLITDIFKNLRKDEVIDLAYEVGRKEIHDIVLFMKSNVTMESFIEWIQVRMKNSSMQINHIVTQDTHIYTMKHNICLNWSLYHKIILESIFKEIIHKEVEIDISETAFTIRFSK